MLNLSDWISENLGIHDYLAGKITVSILVIAVWMLIRWIIVAILGRQVRSGKDKYYWIRAVKYTLAGIVFVSLVFIWGSEIESFATFIGLISAALTIALKDLFVNFAGWIFLLVRKPFQLGDRVQIGEHMGDVIDIRIFQFTINEIGHWVDADQSTGRIIHIPNGKVFTEPQANFSQGFSHIWHEINVMITFDSNWQKAKGILTEIVNEHAASLTKAAEKKLIEATKRYMILYSRLTPIVYTKVKESGIQFSMRFLITPHRRRTAEQAIWEDILQHFSENEDIRIAYPTQRIYYKGQDGDGPNKLT